MPLPAFYDDFDPDAWDRERERLEAIVHEHWQDDLRSLRSEAEHVEQAERWKNRPGQIDYVGLQEAYEAEHPPPPDDAFHDRAVWQWELWEHIHAVTGRDDQLARHRLERGAYIERHAAIMERSSAWVGGLFGGLKERAKDPPPPIPWPIGDGVTEWRRELGYDPSEPGRPSDRDEPPEGARDEPSYDACLDLSAGLFGWHESLRGTGADRDLRPPFARAVRKGTSAVERAYAPDLKPGTIGGQLALLTEGLGHFAEALALLDGLAGHAWMTPEAYHRLRELVGAARDATLDRYVQLREVYAAYRDRAARVLGAAFDDPTSEEAG